MLQIKLEEVESLMRDEDAHAALLMMSTPFTFNVKFHLVLDLGFHAC